MTHCSARSVSGLLAMLATIPLQAGGLPPAMPRSNVWIPDEGIQAVEPLEDEDLVYIGGSFTWVGPPTGPAAVIDVQTGVPDLSIAKVVGGAVHAIEPDGMGGWYIGGDFQSVGGLPRRGLAHILSDGAVDPLWDPDAPGVTDIAISGDRMYLASAGSVGGRPRQGLAAIDLATGIVHEDWIPIADGPVTDIETAGAVLFVAGSFEELTFQSRRSLGALDLATGAVLPWNPSPQASFENPSGGARTLEVAGERLYVAGQFGVISGQARQRVAAFDAKTLTLLQWSPSIDDGYAHDIEVAGDTVFLGGRIMSVGGQARTHVAAVDAQTGAVLPLAPSISDTEPQGGTTVEVNVLAYAAGTLYVGGHYTNVNGAYVPHLNAIDATTGALKGWPAHAAGPGPTQVYALAVEGDTVMAGGNFYIVGGEARENAAALRLSTGDLSPWSPSVSGRVSDMLVVGGRIYISGDFDTVNGAPRFDVAALDRATGQTVAAFNANMSGASSQAVNHLDIKDDTLYLGGRFFSVAGVQRQHIAAIDATTGALHVNWNGAVGAINVIHDMTLSADKSVLYVGGLFGGVFQIGGKEYTRPKIAAFDADTGQVTEFRAETRLGDVSVILPLDDGTVWVGGTFRAFEPEMGGELVNRRGLAQLDEVTGVPTAWSMWLAGGGVPNGVTGALVKRGSTLYFTGTFTDLEPGWNGGASPPTYHYRPGVAAMDADKPAVLDWQPPFSSPPSQFEFTNATFYASGGFAAYDNEFLPYLAIFDLNADCPADFDGDGQVGSADLSLLLGSWGVPGAADLDGDGAVGSPDLALLLGAWGPCPS